MDEIKDCAECLNFKSKKLGLEHNPNNCFTWLADKEKCPILAAKKK